MDIVERLRDPRKIGKTLDGYTEMSYVYSKECTDAADEIERLRAALKKIATGEGAYGQQAHEYKQITREALNGTKL